MPRVQTAPFRRAGGQRVAISGWYRTDTVPAEAMPEALPDWDQATLVQTRVAVAVDARGVAEDCDLAPESRIRVALHWRSRRGTELRGRGAHLDLACDAGTQSLTLNADVPGSLLAGEIELTVTLTSTAESIATSSLAPNRPGALLWRTSRNLRLEGSASRFPMEWADFSASPALPDGAAWYLNWDTSDLGDSLTGGVRLYLNRAHPLFSQIAEHTASEDLERAAYESLFFDVGRALITGALRDAEFLREPESYSDDSIGATVRRLLNLHFPGESFGALADLLKQQPGRFEALLQERLRLFARFA